MLLASLFAIILQLGLLSGCEELKSHYLNFPSAVQPKSLDPSKDLAAYGYGSIAWKERMENWKLRQEHLHTMNHEKGGKDIDDSGEGPDPPL